MFNENQHHHMNACLSDLASDAGSGEESFLFGREENKLHETEKLINLERSLPSVREGESYVY